MKGLQNHMGFAMLRANGEECARFEMFHCTEVVTLMFFKPFKHRTFNLSFVGVNNVFTASPHRSWSCVVTLLVAMNMIYEKRVARPTIVPGSHVSE